MIKLVISALLATATFAVPAQAGGWLPSPVTQTQEATQHSDAPPALHGRGLPIVSAKDRAAQAAWWARRAERRAERRMAACAAMPECIRVSMRSTLTS